MLTISAAAFLAACGTSESTPTAANESDDPATPFPVPEVAPEVSEEAYPAPTQTVNNDQIYPPPLPVVTVPNPYPDPEDNRDGTLMALNKPIGPKDGFVGGVGVPGLTIFIVNVTAMGEPLGSGVIGDDGTFMIAVGDLEPGIQVGLTADVEGFGLSLEDIIPGERAMSIPQVGYYFDTVVVTDN